MNLGKSWYKDFSFKAFAIKAKCLIMYLSGCPKASTFPIGFKTVEIAIDNNEEISIQLEKDVSALGEVQINAGYYNTREERVRGIFRG